MKKRRHHVVWRHYLGAWATNGTVACLQGRRIFRASTSNVGVEKDFYRLKAMTDADLEFVHEVIAKSPAGAETSHLGWVSFFTDLVKLKSLYDTHGNKSPETEVAFDEAFGNLEEDLHERIEAGAIPHLKALRDRDVTFLSERGAFAKFIFFLCVQQFRTRKLSSAAELRDPQFPDFDLARAWPVLRFIFASNVGSVFFRYREEVRVTLLEADHETRLITGDQPVINVHAIGLAPGQLPEHPALYYPVSPSTAVVVSLQPTNTWPARLTLSGKEADKYNRAIANAAFAQIFAADEQTLRDIISDEFNEGNA
jgi:hypothetical protein